MRTLLLLLITFALFAQKELGTKSSKAEKLFLLGKQEMAYRNFEGAKLRFLEAIRKDPEFALAYLYLLRTLDRKKRYKEALPYAEKLLKIQNNFPTAKRREYLKEMSFLTGKIYFHNEKYEDAYRLLRKFITEERERFDLILEATKLLEKAEFAKEAIKKPVPFKPYNLGEAVNSPYEDYMPYLTADESMIFFTSRRADGNQGYYSPSMKAYTEDFYYAIKNSQGTWSKAKNLGPPINTPENEGAACISQDGKTVLFTGCSRPDGLGSCDIYIANYNGTEWQNPTNLKVINSPAWDAQPCLAHDNRTVYFVSNRSGGVGGADIWVAYFDTKGNLEKIENLGRTINTPGNEYAPFIHADGKTLYFASDAHPGFGGMDLFVSTKTDTGWTKPRNLGYPINTSADERNIYINTFGTTAYYNSNREGSLGKNDLFAFKLPETVKPAPTTFVRGFVRDSVSQKPLKASIVIVELNAGKTTPDTVRTVTSDPVAGKFLFTLPLNKDYAMFVTRKGYLFYSKHFSLKNLPDNTQYFDLDVELLPLKKGASMVLENVFFDTDKADLKEESRAELMKVVALMKKNPKLKIELSGHTDDRASEEYNLQLSKRRAEAVKNFLVEQGISPDRITAKGYGESRPRVPNTSEENRALNRRTELKILEVQ